MNRVIVVTVAALITLCPRVSAVEFAGPHSYRAGDSVIRYDVPRDLVSAFTRVERTFKDAKDPIMFRTAYRSQGFLVETGHGNFTMGVIPTPDGLKPDRSVRALNDYYRLYLSTADTFVDAEVERFGDRDWLHVVCRPTEKPDRISYILHYTEVSADFILYIGLGSGTSAPFHAGLLKKLAPLVERVVASVRISRVAEPEKTDGAR